MYEGLTSFQPNIRTWQIVTEYNKSNSSYKRSEHFTPKTHLRSQDCYHMNIQTINYARGKPRIKMFFFILELLLAICLCS